MLEKPALFLDRDGVINHDHGYVYRWTDFEVIEGIFDVIKYFKDLGYLVIVITNQSGIARGYFSEEQFLNLMKRVRNLFKQNFSEIDDFFYCPHLKDGAVSLYSKDCFCRKPKPGLFYAAKEKYNIDFNNSLMVGDKYSDLIAAHQAGINKLFLYSPNQNQYSQESQIQLKYIRISSLREILGNYN